MLSSTRWSRPAGRDHQNTHPPAQADHRGRLLHHITLKSSLDLTSGRIHARAYEKGRSDYTIQYLQSLLETTAGRALLIWDQARWHTSKKVRTWLDDHERIETYLLPVRSTEANPMEDIWRELKERVAACLERSLDTLLESAQTYLRNLSGKQALQTAGLYVN